MSDKTPTKPTHVPPPDDLHGENTGRIRTLAREEIESWGNGSLKRLEKGQRWTKVALFYIGIVVSSAAGLYHWNNSLAKKSEQEALRLNLGMLGEKVDMLTESVEALKNALPPQKKVSPHVH